MTKTAKQIAWITRHKATIDKYNRQLAIDFDTDALTIVGAACMELDITRKQWDAMQSVYVAWTNGELAHA